VDENEPHGFCSNNAVGDGKAMSLSWEQTMQSLTMNIGLERQILYALPLAFF